ncbi:MAG: type II toxin-antitoxin system RelE/ParE family toxin [Pseudoxanthomonas sp.]
MTIHLSRLARADLDDIRNYTLGTWGRAQWLVYYRRLVAAFEMISDNPDAGRDRSLFVPGMRSLNCEKHVIFYQSLEVAGGGPVILRVVHQRRYLPALIYYDDLS